MPQILDTVRETLGRLKEEEVPWGGLWEYLARQTAAVDELLEGLYEGPPKRPQESEMALVAVGGYGRKEQSPWSDIDLMFLCRHTSSQALLQGIYRILHVLWDLHLEVGHSVRTVEDCVEVSLRDVRTWTALMDARLVAGSPELFQELQGRMRVELFRAAQETFVKGLIQNFWERHRHYARAPFSVEPHLKEGPGGMRDLQSALWLARTRFPVNDLDDLVHHALISQDEADDIRRANLFLWNVRLGLHRLAKRKEDHLTFGMQELLAQSLRMEEPVSGLPVESFMRQYYRCATRIRYFAEEIIQKVTDPSLASGPQGITYVPKELGEGFRVVRGRLTLLDERVFELDPPRMMEAIAYAHREGLDLDLLVRDELKASLHLVDPGFCRSRRVRDAFFSILGTPDCGYKALELMHRVGLLQAYIPEFDRICFQVQHDAYHAYTVDVHSLEAVRELAAIRQAGLDQEEGSLAQVAREVSRWEGLALAAFVHDMGKGEGPGHATRGAEVVENLLERWWIPRTEVERIVFLVREHITLMDMALGRDLTDEKVIADLCRSVGSVERLNDLYLMTIADLKATGPDLITDWKDQLLRELYLKAKRLLETGDLVSPEATQKIRAAREQVRTVLADRLEKTESEQWLQSLSGRYLLTTPPEDLPAQVLMAVEMHEAGEMLRLQHQPREGYHEIVVCTRDAPALFSRICGVLVAHGFNILGARIHTWANGIVMDAFQVESLSASEPALNPEILERMRQDLAAVLGGKEDLKQLLSKRALPPLLRADRYPAVNPRLKIDNRSSDFYTILELRANDRFGLLFAITSTLAELKLDIHLALIDTRKGHVVDVFYVQELTGQKVWGDERLALVEREIHRALERLESSQAVKKE